MKKEEIIIKSEDLEKYIEKIKLKIDPLTDIIDVEKQPAHRKALQHIISPQYTGIADVFRDNDIMERYISDHHSTRKLFNIQVSGKGLLYDYGLKRLAADNLVEDYKEKLQEIDGELFEAREDLGLKRHYIAAKVACEVVVYRLTNDNIEFNVEDYEIKEESNKISNELSIPKNLPSNPNNKIDDRLSIPKSKTKRKKSSGFKK